LLECCVGELHLSLDADGAGDPKPARRLDRILQQGGLADTRFPVHDQDPAAPAAGRLEEPVQRLALTVAPEQLLSRLLRDHLKPVLAASTQRPTKEFGDSIV
jgi:hypothetical protein